MNTIDLELFTDSYLEIAQWVFMDSYEDFSDDAKGIAKNDCLAFIGKVIETFGEEKGIELLNAGGQDVPYLAGHDFFLTRNGHGAGFWDSPEKYNGQYNADILTGIAVGMGESNPYNDDEGTLSLD